MRGVIIGVTVIVLIGLGIAAWMLLTPRVPAGASESPVPGTSATGAGTPLAGPSPEATPVDGSEVPAPEEGTAPSDRLPALPQPTPLIAAPLPENASATGELVAGFPSSIASAAGDDEVLESSVTSDGRTMQAALKARTDATPATVTDRFRASWSALGLTPTGGEQVSASDPFTTVTLAFTESGTGTIYTVYATLRTE